MEETNVNGQLVHEEQRTNVNKDITKVVDENKYSGSALKHAQTLDNCENEETDNDTSKLNNLSAEIKRHDSTFDEKEAEKYGVCESKTNADSVSNRENFEIKIINSIEEENKNRVQDSTSVDGKRESSAKESLGEGESVPSFTDTAQEHSKELNLQSGQTTDYKEADVNISGDTENKEENTISQAMVIENEQSKEVIEETTDKIEEQGKISSHVTKAVPEAMEPTESCSLVTESIAQPKPQETVADVERKMEDVQTTDNTPSDDIKPSNSTQLEARNSVWYSDEAEREAASPKPEGYSTTVVGGVVIRKPLSSSSSPEHKKSSPKINRGSIKTRMSWESIFGKRKTSKSDLRHIETMEHDGNERVMEESTPVEKDSTQEIDGMDMRHEEKTLPGELTEAVEGSNESTEKSLQTCETSQTESDEQKIHEGEIVPIEQGVAEADIDKLANVEGTEESPQDEDKLLRERIAKRQSLSLSSSPEKHMQMRFSYAEGSNAGEKEVEVIGTREIAKRSPNSKSNLPAKCQYSCRELGDVDHEGWLAKKGGGAIFSSWKRKWVVLKERHLYYYKTSFDIEAGGVVFLDEKCSITAAPELKRKYSFKVDCEGPKPHKLSLAADSQEEMDKWLSVLSAARRGEVIVRKTRQQTSDNVKMRKKTSSVSKRCGSVLGVGGLYEYNGSLQKSSPIQRRASFGSSLNDENQKQLSLALITSDGEENPAKESDKQIQESSEAEVIIDKRDEIRSEMGDFSTTIEATEVDEVQSAAPPNGPGVSFADEEEKKKVAPESSLSVEGQSFHEISSTKEKTNIAPFVQVVETTEDARNQSEESNNETSQIQEGTEQTSQSHETTEQTNHVEEKTEQSSKMVGTKQSEPETVEQISQSDQRTEQMNQSDEIIEANQSNDNIKLARSSTSSSTSKSDRSSNTTWYIVLDEENDVWVEYESKNNDDELLSLVKTIKGARITITGTPLPGNEERGRAMTLVSPQNAEVLKLNELKRSLKSKERDLKAIDELLNKEINRQSFHEWSFRYSYLTDDICQEPFEDDGQDDDTCKTTSSEESNSRHDIKPLEEARDEKETSFDVKESEVFENNKAKIETLEKKNSEDESNTGRKTSGECQDEESISNEKKMKDENDKISNFEHGEILGNNSQNNEELKEKSGQHDESRENTSEEETFDTKL